MCVCVRVYEMFLEMHYFFVFLFVFLPNKVSLNCSKRFRIKLLWWKSIFNQSCANHHGWWHLTLTYNSKCLSDFMSLCICSNLNSTWLMKVGKYSIKLKSLKTHYFDKRRRKLRIIIFLFTKMFFSFGIELFMHKHI